MVGSGGVAVVGVWCLLFAGGGADGDGGDRVSGWPFGNLEADRRRERKVRGGRGR